MKTINGILAHVFTMLVALIVGILGGALLAGIGLAGIEDEVPGSISGIFASINEDDEEEA